MPRLTADDLATRHEGLGATDIVEIAGLAPWEDAGPWHVFNQKTGVTPPTPPTEEQSWGHTQELVIASWYLTNVGEFHDVGKVYHPSIPYIWATLDGLRPERTVEIKNVSGFMARHWAVGDPDGVPHYVRGQVQIGMRCARREECHVVASLAGRPRRSGRSATTRTFATCSRRGRSSSGRASQPGPLRPLTRQKRSAPTCAPRTRATRGRCRSRRERSRGWLGYGARPP